MPGSIISYLTFNGNCREAMNFYKECIGGTLRLQTLGETPDAGKMPETMQEYVIHATLKSETLVLMATDLVGEMGLIKGNAVSLLLNCSSEKEMRKYYKKLRAGGMATQLLEKNFFGVWLGSLTDKYGNYWLLHFNSG